MARELARPQLPYSRIAQNAAITSKLLVNSRSAFVQTMISHRGSKGVTGVSLGHVKFPCQ